MAKAVRAVILLALAFVVYRLAQPRIRAYSFANVIKQEVESKQVRPSPNELRKRIVQLEKDYGLDTGTDTDDDVIVTQMENGGFEVKVHYDMPVDLGIYLYQEHFDFVTRTQTGALPQ